MFAVLAPTFCAPVLAVLLCSLVLPARGVLACFKSVLSIVVGGQHGQVREREAVLGTVSSGSGWHAVRRMRVADEVRLRQAAALGKPPSLASSLCT